MTRTREEAARAAVKPLINSQLRGAKEPLTGTVTPGADALPPEGVEAPPAPAVPAPLTATVSEAPATATQYTMYRGIAPDQILRIQVPPAGQSGGTMVLDYQSQQYLLRYLMREVKSLTEQSFEWPPTRSFKGYARLVKSDPRLRPGMNGGMDVTPDHTQES